MIADRWKRIDELLDAALELSPDEHEPFVTQACAGDEALRQQVLTLLARQGKLAGFMEGSAMGAAAKAMAATVADQSASFIGQEVGPYVIDSLLGAGGMGQVYLAHDRKLKRKIALKILPPEFSADPERVRRFEHEARAVSALNHPGIVTIHDFGEKEGWRYIATELVEGKTLHALIGDGLALKETLTIAMQVAEALAAAHGAGVIHRDIKPENIMVRPDGYVKVLDFGLAKRIAAPTESASGLTKATQTGMVMGTLPYMSPEQAAGDAVDHQTDLWSLGAVLYEMVAGRTPFVRDSRQATLNAILASQPEPISAAPPELDRILRKALEKDRALRYQTAAELRTDLQRLLRRLDSPLSRPGQKAAAPRRPRPAYLVPAVAVGLLVLLSGGFLFWRLRLSRKDAPDWSRATHIQLTDQPGTEFHPSLAPDGKSFVYAGGDRGNLDLFLQRVGGKNPVNLTKDSLADDTEPVFSPDGEHIAFRSSREPRGIYVMEATGENVRRVAAGGFNPSWSPDGQEIVFSEAGQDSPSVRVSSALWIVNAVTGAKRLLTPLDAMQPAWSPGGKRIAFWFLPPSVGRRDIATIPRSGGEPVVITKGSATNWNPVWSPDGKFLYFVSDRAGNMNFWRVAIDEESGEALSEPEAIVTPSKFSRHLGFSRDGKRMIYVQTENRSNIQAAAFDASEGRVTGEPFWITRGDREIVRPELSADGKQFVARLSRRTQDDIVTVSRDGTGWLNLTNDSFFDRYPRWSPDGRRVAFASDRSGGYEIWMIDVDGTNLRRVTYDSPKEGTSFPVWSPDGTKLTFRRAGVSSIIDSRKSWNEQNPQPLPPLDNPDDRFVVWDWSPDGAKLAIQFGGTQAGTGYYSFATSRYEILSKVESSPSWLPDSRRLIFAHDDGVFLADTENKDVQKIFTRPFEQVRSASVSRDGRLLYFTELSTESDIWLLDLN